MISIVVPVYKSEKTLKKCVYSLLNQTDKDFEILLIVDGPPDNSGILCDELAKEDARIRVINQVNQGVSKARNRGIKEAKGELIRFVDSDDFVDPDSSESMKKAMMESGADLVVAGYHHLYFDRDILKVPKDSCLNMENLSAEDEDAIRKLYLDGYFNMPWNKLYKREIIKEGFPTDMNLGEDLVFNQGCILNASKIAVISHPVCNYIQDDRGTTLSTKRRMDKMAIALNLYEHSKSFFEKLKIDDKKAPATKAMMEFIDDMEGLAYDSSMKKEEKKAVIRSYEEGLPKLSEDAKGLYLPLLDYRIIYYFYTRKHTNIVYFLIVMRGWLVKILKKRG